MYMTNFHTHTARCKHAQDSDDEYVRAALEAGYDEFGFADHCPWPYTNGFVSNIRMSVDQLDEYLASIRTLQHMQSSWHSDPTSRIAKLYRRVNLVTNRAVRDELANAILETQEGLDQMKECVEALPDRSRRILELLYFQGKTWEETAEKEGIAIQTLSYHRIRGIKKITAMLPYRMMFYESV